MSLAFGGSEIPIVELPASALADPASAIRYLVEQLAAMGTLPPSDVPEVLAGVLRREALGSTSIGRGLALPHYHGELVLGAQSIIGTTATGIVWPNSLDRLPVRRVLLALAPRTMEPGAHLRWLEGIIAHMRTERNHEQE
jgi:mannitol/fructose-specific phosphotransferase system IIA component (Ntr-type)